MELRLGYKQTEVGVIPEDWEIHTIGDSMRLINGRAFKPEDWKERGIPIIRIQNLNDPDSTFNYCTTSIEDRHLVEAGDLLFAWSGTTGTSFGARVWGGPTGVLNQHIFKVIPDQKRLTATYAFLVLCKVQESIEKQAHGFKASFVHVKKSDLVGVQLPLPPTKAEQEAIAEALSDTDALIESLEQLITKKRHLKQGAMQELLTGKKRLSGFSGEWEVKRLDAVAEIRSGGTPSTSQSDFWDGDVLWCTPTDITSLNAFKYMSQTARTITLQGLKSSSAELIPAHSVVMTSRATIGECAINTVPMATNQGFKNFIPFQDTDVDFLYYLLQTKKQDFVGLCGGSTFLEIGKIQLAAFELVWPKKPEQSAIAIILSDMDAEITALETKLAKTRQLKQGMMHNLLTGRIRLV